MSRKARLPLLSLESLWPCARTYVCQYLALCPWKVASKVSVEWLQYCTDKMSIATGGKRTNVRGVRWGVGCGHVAVWHAAVVPRVQDAAARNFHLK
jgi:hypothetical protein